MIDYQPNRPEHLLHRKRRSGITVVELIISAVLLVTVMSFVTTICFRINLVWKDVNHHRVAMGELSNQLEVLTRLTRQEALAAVDAIQPSSVCASSLRNPELSGELVDDDFGSRIVLRINWDRRNPSNPVELAGWIVRPTEVGK